jgi:FKBP-type peptidyl-prolyl cis-trans isomerase FklB
MMMKTMMKARLSTLGLCALMALNAGAQEARKTPSTPSEKMGYAVGAEFANKFRKDKLEFDYEMAIQGMRDAYADKLQLSKDDLDFVLKGFQAELRRKVAANRQLASLANRERNEKFFTAHKAEPGVQLLPSGVQYKVIKAGDGPKPNDMSTVSVNYRGTLLDGTEFDKTDEGKPGTLKVGTLVAGWRAVMNAMPVGSHWQVWIPSGLAYAERGAGTVIGPQEPLVFDIELLAITK